LVVSGGRQSSSQRTKNFFLSFSSLVFSGFAAFIDFLFQGALPVVDRSASIRILKLANLHFHRIFQNKRAAFLALVQDTNNFALARSPSFTAV
jgi:hypothetical protein